MEARFDSGLYSRYFPLPLKEGVEETVAIALGERVEDFPGVTVVTDWRRVYPYAPLASHVVGYMGAITAEDQAEYDELGYDTSLGGEQVGRSGVELSMETTLHGQWGEAVYEVDANNRIVREISYKAPVNGMDIQLSVDLDLQQYAERLLQTQLRLKRQFTVANPEVEKPDGHARADGRVEGRRPARAVQGAGRLGHRDEPPDRADRGDGQLPDVRQPLVQLRCRQRQVRPDLPPRGRGWARARSRPLGADQPGHPGPVQHGLVVQAVHRLRRAGHRSARAQLDLQRRGHVQADVDRRRRVRAGRALRVPQLDVPAGRRAVPVRHGQRAPPRWPCPATRSSTSWARSSTTRPARSCRTTCRSFGFGADTGIDLPFEFGGRVPTNELKAKLVEDGVLAEGETPNLQPGDLLQMAIGQGLMAATPLQLAVGYGGVRQRRRRAHAPRGAGDLRARDARRRPRVRRPLAGQDRPADRPPEHADRDDARAAGADLERAAPQRHRTRARTVARRRPRSCSPTTRRAPSRSPARPGRPRVATATRGTTRRRSPRSASIPSSRGRWCRTSRSRASARRARRRWSSACSSPCRGSRRSTRWPSPSRSTRRWKCRPSRSRASPTDCMRSSNAGTIRPVD